MDTEIDSKQFHILQVKVHVGTFKSPLYQSLQRNNSVQVYENNKETNH